MVKVPLSKEVANEKVAIETRDGTRHEDVRAKVRGGEMTIATRSLSVRRGDTVLWEGADGVTRAYKIVGIRRPELLDATILDVVTLGKAEDAGAHSRSFAQKTIPAKDTPVHRPATDRFEDGESEEETGVFTRCRQAIRSLEEIDDGEREELIARLDDLEKARGDKVRLEAAYERFTERAERYSVLQEFGRAIAQKLVRSL